MKLNFEKNKGRLDPNIKKYLTGEYTERYTDRVIEYDKRTDFEKKADEVLKIPKGKPTDISGRYKEYPPQAEDTLVVGTERYGNYLQDENMVPVAELEDQEFGQENDPEKTFVPIEEVADPDSFNNDFEIKDGDLDAGNEEVDENSNNKAQEYSEKKDPREVLINGVPLGDIMDGKIPEEELPQRPIKDGIYSEQSVQKISVNRKKSTKLIDQGTLDETGKYKKSKITRLIKSINAKNAKRKNLNTKNPFKPWKRAQKQIIEGDDPRMTV